MHTYFDPVPVRQVPMFQEEVIGPAVPARIRRHRAAARIDGLAGARLDPDRSGRRGDCSDEAAVDFDRSAHVPGLRELPGGLPPGRPRERRAFFVATFFLDACFFATFFVGLVFDRTTLIDPRLANRWRATFGSAKSYASLSQSVSGASTSSRWMTRSMCARFAVDDS